MHSQLQPTRYSTRPFPPYRFIPGRAPHPTESRDGHSYRPPGTPPHEPVRFVPPEHWRESEDYLFGCDLYNYGYWWEAHEAWEGLWQTTDKRETQGRFLQGLIQVSACHLKLEMDRERGVRELLRKSGEHVAWVLERLNVPVYMGVELAGWYDRVAAYFRRRLAVKDSGLSHDPETYPFLRLA